MSKGNRAPDGWSDYKAINDVIEGTRFLPFKTPFKKIVQGESFNPDDLLRRVGNLGFVLNLVKTDRYYNPAVYRIRKVEHQHLALSGGGQLPVDGAVEQIFRVLDRFVQNNKSDKDKLIGVHCTHGVNRTGYIICRYMICKLGIEPEEAIRRFETGRGHKFDHIEYTDALLSMRTAIDRDAYAWHSIGGSIKSGVKEEEEADFDPDKLDHLKRRRNRQSPSTNESQHSGRFSRNGADHRRRGDSDQDQSHSRRRNSSSSSRSRTRDRSRSPLRSSASGDYSNYDDRPGFRDTPDQLWRYVGPRAPEINFRRAERYLGPSPSYERRRH